MHISLVFIVVAAIVSAASTIPCNVGDLENHEVVHGFKECTATYDFVTGSTHLSGRREGTPAVSSNDQVPGFLTYRSQECAVKSHRGSMQIRCTCKSATCNAAVTPMQLIEDRFSDF